MGSLPQLSIIKGPTRPLTPNLINNLVEANAKGPNSDKVALLFEENGKARKCTYAQLDKITNKMARAIAEIIKTKNLKPNLDGDYIVAVNMHPSDQLVMVLLSIWKAGGAYLPLDHSFPEERTEHIVNEAKPVMIVYDEDFKNDLDTLKLSYQRVTELSKDKSEASVQDEEKVHHLKDDLAMVLYTSGSTGRPKGVRLPHKVLLNRLQWQFRTLPYSHTEQTCVFKTALTFVDSVQEIWGPLISGITLLVIPKNLTKNPEKLINILHRYKIERLVLVPSLLRSMLAYLQLQKNNSLLSSLKIWICSGEVLPIWLVEEFFKYFPENEHKMCNFFGSTEVMGDVTFHVISKSQELKEFEKIPIGIPLDNTIIYLLDADLRPVKAGEIGEMFVSGLNLAAGYTNGRDKEKFLQNQLAIDPSFTTLFRMGDFGRIENGVLLYEGRLDSQVKVRGHRVDLVEIEKTVHSVEGIEKAVVLCYKPGDMNQALLAFVTASNMMSENQIENILRTRLTSYMVPQVILVESIPLLVNGKIDRQALLREYENGNNIVDGRFQPNVDYKGVLPHQQEAAKVLFETIASVLAQSVRSVISVEANFYEIGGNSLNSIYTILKLNEHGYSISIGDFISAMDLGEVLERMMACKTAIYSKPPTYTSELLKDEYKLRVIDIITTSFYGKADLEQWIKSDIKETDYADLLNEIWAPLVEANLSFVVKNDTGKIIACALNFDARDEPEVEVTSKLDIIFEFLESVEGPIRDTQLPPGKNAVLHAFMMGTHSSLTPKENVSVMQYMEEETLRLATARHFKGIFTTNTSPLTQQLGTVYQYQTMLNYQINQYVAKDKTKPFGKAKDNQKVLVQWKPT